MDTRGLGGAGANGGPAQKRRRTPVLDSAPFCRLPCSTFHYGIDVQRISLLHSHRRTCTASNAHSRVLLYDAASFDRVRRPQKYVVDSFAGGNSRASAEEERLFRLALENSKRVTSLPDLLNQVPDAPVFRPTLEEFADPLRYIESIFPQAEAAGICKVIPPEGWDMPMGCDPRSLRFRTKLQAIDKLQEGVPYHDGKVYGYDEYLRAAVRFGERARAARGLADDFVHGGAIETVRCPGPCRWISL